MWILIKKIYSRLRPYRGRMIISLFLSLIGTITTIINPQFMRFITDEIALGILHPMNLQKIVFLVIAALAFLLFGGVLNFIQNVILAKVSQLMGKNLRSEVNDKIDKIPLAFFDTRQLGDIMNRITSDIDLMLTALTNYLSSLITALVTVVCVIFIMLHMNVILTFVVVGTNFIFLFVNKFLMSKSQPYFIKQQMLAGKVNSLAEETFNGHLVVKSFNAEEKIKEDFKKSNDELYDSAKTAQFVAGLMLPVSTAGGLVTQFFIILVSSYFIKGGLDGVTLGVMIAFTNYSSMFSQMLSNISNFTSFLQPAMAAAGRIFELLEENEIKDSTSLSNKEVKGDVKFDHVKFGYVPDRIIIHNFSAEIKAGQKIAIIGPTGAGKSTIMNLLMKFYELNDGEIYFDGIPIKDISYRNLHDFIGLVPQEIWTFEGSVKENIIYSSQNISDERLNEVLAESGLDYFVRALPEGVDTVINETSNLSVGQKQLITIARAMIKNSPVLILDEATSSVDTRTEKIIQNALDSLMKGRTSFIIAHRLSTIRNADLILAMKDGDVVEAGTHEELLAKKGLYADLYNSQFSQNINL